MKRLSLLLAASLLLTSCSSVNWNRKWGRCAVLGGLGGASFLGLLAVTGNYAADSNLDIMWKITHGEPLDQALSHHVTTTNEYMVVSGVTGVLLGGALGAVAGHLYCDPLLVP